MTFIYCPICGSKTEQREIGDEGNMPFCIQCNRPLFPFSYSCILTLIIDENQDFAFIQQNNIPSHLYIGVAGYPKQGEVFEDAVKREVFEETGLNVEKVTYVKSYSYAKKDMIMVGFVSEVKRSPFKLSKEVDNAKWFSKEEAGGVLREDSVISRLFHDYMQLSKGFVDKE